MNTDKLPRHLLLTFCGFALGLCLGRWTDFSFGVLLLALSAACFAGALLWLGKKSLFFSLLPLVLLAGLFYYDLRDAKPLPSLTAGTRYEITGMVASFPNRAEKSSVFLLHTSAIDGAEEAMTLRVVAPADAGLSYGAVVRLEGEALAASQVQNPGQFDYDRYFREQGIAGTVSVLYGGSLEATGENAGNPLLRAAYFWRGKFVTALSYLPERQAALVGGIFLGDKSGLSAADMNILSQSGVMHAFSVSGLHVGYIILLFSAIFRGLGLRRWRQFFLLLPVLFLYMAMTGFLAPVVRATVMALMLLAAKTLGREQDGYTALAFAAFLLLLVDPRQLFMVSFQLSFLAMFSLLYFSPFFRRLLKGNFPLKEELVLLLAAQTGLLPLVAYYFYTVSIVSFFVNSIACFFVGLIVILSVFALPLVFFPGLAALFLYGAGLLSDVTWQLVQASVQLPWAYRYVGEVSVWQLCLCYGLLLALPLLCALPGSNAGAGQMPRVRLRAAGRWTRVGRWFCRREWAAALVMTAVLVFTLLPWSQGGGLRVTFLSVGEGTAIHIATPEGKNILLDAGGGDPETAANYILLPYLKSKGVTRIDMFISSHAHDDHLGGIYVLLENLEIGEIALAAAGAGDYEPLLAAAADRRIPVRQLTAGDALALDEKTRLEILYPTDAAAGTENELCLASRLTYGETAFLFTADLEQDGIKALLGTGQDLDADVMELPHHGSPLSYDPQLYRAASPAAAVISVGPNSYGHPGENVVSFWQKNRLPLFRTDEDGAILFTSDGETIRVSTFQ